MRIHYHESENRFLKLYHYRRIIRLTVLVLAVPLLLWGYVGSYLLIYFALGIGALSPITPGSTMHRVTGVYAPLLYYADSDAPGAAALRRWPVEIYQWGESLR